MAAHNAMDSEDSRICSSEKPKLNERSLLSSQQATEMEALFKILGNQTRLRMIHALVRAGEICLKDLALSLRMKPQAISNQLQRLVNRNMLGSRRKGNNIFYRIIDPCIVSLLETALCLLDDAKQGEARRLRRYDGISAKHDEQK
jgi:ArsR family transcriptional regulator, lead/cadmium/zinc/bismuth-responsive transcriptional repressor